MGGVFWQMWTDEQWDAFVERYQIQGGIVARVPMTVRVHCRACGDAVMSREADEPLAQLYFTQEDSSSIYCIPCAKKVKWTAAEPDTEPKSRAAWMRYEQKEAEKHIVE